MRRCGLVSPVVERRGVNRRRARAEEVIAEIVEDGMIAVDVGGIVGVGGMNRVAVEASVPMRLGRKLRGWMQCRRSSMRSRVG